VLKQLLGGANWRCPPWFDSPFHCNYGFNIHGELWRCCLNACASQAAVCVQLASQPFKQRSTTLPQFTLPCAVGKHTYLNMNCTILDDSTVTIGDRVLMGPNVKVRLPGRASCMLGRSAGRLAGSRMNVARHAWLVCCLSAAAAVPSLLALPTARLPSTAKVDCVPAPLCIPQIYAVGHPVDPEARKGTQGSLIVKPVRVRHCI